MDDEESIGTGIMARLQNILPPSSRLPRRLAERALSRTSGAPLSDHNRVLILKDAEQNYPAWLAAICAAKQFVHLENYIFQEDETGRMFADALASKAREGVTVRVVHDWLGTWRSASKTFWRKLEAAGVHVRCFNPPRLDSPFGWLTRDHRKTIAVDGRVAFVAGLCISHRWRGNAARDLAGWRDTGIEMTGPAVAAVHAAFAQIWQATGPPLPADELPRSATIRAAGDVALRVVAGTPLTAGLLRTDQLVAALASRSLWLTDAYFIGVAPYVQALLAAARDGVDVRLLVPRASDLPAVRSLSRAGFRALLEGGVRIFEWNGPMLHAKTAVADGRWSRIGSSNLNLASLLGNYELDVAIDDTAVARDMESMYLDDLAHATEVVLSQQHVVPSPGMGDLIGKRRRRGRKRQRHRLMDRAGSGSVAAAGAIRVASTVGAAMTNRRVLGPAEAGLLLVSGSFLLLVALLAVLWPMLLAVPLAGVAAYLGLTLLWRAHRLRARARRGRMTMVAGLTRRLPASEPLRSHLGS